jgi:hypothetical protein
VDLEARTNILPAVENRERAIDVAELIFDISPIKWQVKYDTSGSAKASVQSERGSATALNIRTAQIYKIASHAITVHGQTLGEK